eukprot:1161637-Pelagomonas_calceolata.AAC.3
MRSRSGHVRRESKVGLTQQGGSQAARQPQWACQRLSINQTPPNKLCLGREKCVLDALSCGETKQMSDGIGVHKVGACRAPWRSDAFFDSNLGCLFRLAALARRFDTYRTVTVRAGIALACSRTGICSAFMVYGYP